MIFKRVEFWRFESRRLISFIISFFNLKTLAKPANPPSPLGRLRRSSERAVLQRKVGRPPKGKAEVGKEGLIRKAREELRLRRFDIFNRKDLANACAVTPALISYYFQNADEILDVVVSRVIEKHYIDLRAIVRSDENLNDKYTAAVDFLIETFRLDVNLFETYEYALAMGQVKGPDFVSLAHGELTSLFQDCFIVGIPNAFDRSVFHGAVWGMCKAAAKYDAEAAHASDNGFGKTKQLVPERDTRRQASSNC